MLEAEGFDAGVVSAVEFSVDDHSDSESCAEGVADEVVVFLGAAGLFQAGVDFGKGPAEGFTVGIEVSVVVDIYRDSEPVLEEGAEGDTVPE